MVETAAAAEAGLITIGNHSNDMVTVVGVGGGVEAGCGPPRGFHPGHQ